MSLCHWCNERLRCLHEHWFDKCSYRKVTAAPFQFIDYPNGNVEVSYFFTDGIEIVTFEAGPAKRQMYLSDYDLRISIFEEYDQPWENEHIFEYPFPV